MTGSLLTLPLTAKWRIATVPFLAIFLLMVLTSPFNLHAPAAAEGTVPTATITPTVTSTPNSTPASPADTATSDEVDTQAQSAGLFSKVEGEPPPSFDVETLASHLVDIDFEQLASVTNPQAGLKDSSVGEPPTPQTLVLNLFDDVVFTGIVEHVEPTASGHALWGKLDGVELGTLTLVVNGKVVVGTVRTPYAVYTIRTAGDGTYVIRQIDESSLPTLGEPLERSPSPRDPSTQSTDIPPDDGSVIDVMVVYTPLAKHLEGGRAAIEALIDLFVAETNQAYANSGVFHRIRLVLREEVDYVEDGSSALGRLRNDSDGSMDHIHELRDVYAADLVHLVVGRTGGFYCGKAASVGGDESYGFAITGSSCGGITFAHELGHNMGLNHDRYVVGVPVSGSNYGYVNQRAFEPGAPESAWWRTIMAYNDQCYEHEVVLGCPKVAYFSNPEKTYKGDPMGVPVESTSIGVDGPADAVGTLNDRREIVANFRRSSASPTPRVGLALSQYWLPENGGVATVRARLHRPSSADTVVTVSVSPSEAVTLSESRTLTIRAGETVSEGTVTITGVDNADQTGDINVTVSATATNTSDLGVIPPEQVVLAVVDDETTPVVTLSLSPEEVFEGDDRRERLTLVTTSLDNRSSVETTVTLSASPAKAVEEIFGDTLTIPAGQLVSDWLARLIAVDDTEFTEAKKTVTVSGTATNSLGVTGPDSVTLTILDDDAPIFADDSISFSFTAGVTGHRFLPEADFGNGPLTYSISPALSSGVTFTPGSPARIGVNSTAVAIAETSFTLTATDAEGDTGTMTVNITVLEGVCPNSAAVSGYSDPEIVRDCEALLVSKHVLGGEQLLNWGKDLSMREWQGVSITDNRVVEVDTFNLGLAGSIPSELGSLANLQELRLGWNELTGPIPPELGELYKLETLYLGLNQLIGPIPSELDKLNQLSRLSLAQNQLSGEIPVWLGDLPNLQDLDLGWNQLTGDIPAELGGLDKLQRLRFDLNPLSGGEIPVWLGGLSNLQTLGLRSIQLTGAIPPELGDLDNLRDLDLAGNQLTGPIPSELGNLSQLSKLSLGHNELSGEVPAWLSGLPHLWVLSLNWNQLTGTIPPELGDLDNLIQLGLANNQLTGPIPSELGKLSSLIELSLSDNLLTGSIPSELGDLASLKFLELSGNELTGCIPPALRNVPNNDLDQLILPFCSASSPKAPTIGTVTPGLASLAVSWSAPLSDDSSAITSYDLRYIETAADETRDSNWTLLEDVWTTGSGDFQYTLTGLTGGSSYDLQVRAVNAGGDGPWSETATGTPTTVTDHEILIDLYNTTGGDNWTNNTNWLSDEPLGDWHGVTTDGGGRVTKLDLTENRLSGRMPSNLGDLSSLSELRLGNNHLSGPIPSELGKLSLLTRLDLENNDLSGPIPSQLGGMSDLRVLLLGDNNLSGRVPAQLGNLGKLSYLRIRNNDLTGAIPPEFGSLKNLTHLYANDNDLVGSIPSELGNLSNLRYLFLNDNDLSGSIPAALGQLDKLVYLWLNHNDLTGPIPGEIGSLPNLVRLYVNHNNLSGAIPRGLGGLDKLELLYVHRNNLTGAIPRELGSLANLKRLYAYDNDLSGAIPIELGRLANLERLHIAENDLSGSIPSELGEMSSLSHLILSLNDLTGEIPPSLGRLSNLQVLSLSNNELSGAIPAELGDLSALIQLYLGNNYLEGCIPTKLRDVPSNDLDSLGLQVCIDP